MNNKGLDEMQLQKRNAIGNQTFVLLLFLLLFDAGLYGLGVRWVHYPENVMMILALCAGIYVIRLAAANAVVGPSPNLWKPLPKAVLILAGAILAAAAVFVFVKDNGFASPGTIKEMSAPLLFIAAGAAILIAAVALVINYNIRNRNDE